MKIEKNKKLSETKNELYDTLPKMEVEDSIFIGKDLYIDRKEILADVRAYNSENSKDLKVRIRQDKNGFRLWLISDKPKKSHGMSKKDRSIIVDTAKNEFGRLASKIEGRLMKLEKETK